jgi:hypothetical protein
MRRPIAAALAGGAVSLLLAGSPAAARSGGVGGPAFKAAVAPGPCRGLCPPSG